MKVELFAFCVAATNGAMGELNILGLTEVIAVPQVPIAIGCAIVIKLRFQHTEVGLKEIKTSIINADGKMVCPPMVQKLNVQIPAGGSQATVGTIQNIQNLLLPSAGQYQACLVVNEREEATLPLQVYQPPQFQKPPTQVQG